MKKNKINLTNLKVQSFVTQLSEQAKQTINGGAKGTGCADGATCGIIGKCLISV